MRGRRRNGRKGTWVYIEMGVSGKGEEEKMGKEKGKKRESDKEWRKSEKGERGEKEGKGVRNGGKRRGRKVERESGEKRKKD